MRQLMVQLVLVLLGEMNASPLRYESTITTIMEIRSRSSPSSLTPVMDIMEKLTLQIVKQLFVMMKYCIELVLSRWSPFEFVRLLLKNQIENIKQTRGSDWAKVYHMLVEQLGIYTKDLRNLERVREPPRHPGTGAEGDWREDSWVHLSY